MRHDTASGHHRRGRGAQRWGKRWLATGAAKVGRQRRGAQNCGERWLQSGTRGGSKGEEKGTAGTMDDVAIRGEQASAPRAATSGQAQSEDNGESAVKRRHHEGRPRRPARGSATTPPPPLGRVGGRPAGSMQTPLQAHAHTARSASSSEHPAYTRWGRQTTAAQASARPPQTRTAAAAAPRRQQRRTAIPHTHASPPTPHSPHVGAAKQVQQKRRQVAP